MTGAPGTGQNMGVLEHYVAQSKKFKGQVGALMRAIDLLAKTASSTHFRALF